MDFPGQERGNCPFFLKTGACRHGNGCRQLHNRPTISRTLLLSNMYQHPDTITMPDIDQDKTQKHFENFYIDIFEELSKYGEIESLNVCDNLASHMIGNVYVQFCNEEQAEAAMRGLKGRYYNGRSIIVDYIPVMDFFMATCRRLHWNRCNMKGICNYIHVKKIRDDLGKELFGRYGRSYSWSYGWSSSYRRDRESRERSHERVDHRRRSSERRTRSEGRSRSGSPSYRRDRESRERSHERVDHRRRSTERRTRSEGRSRSRSPSYRRDRERSHERVDHRRRSNERRTRSEGRSRSRSPSYRRDRSSRERSHERGDHRRNSEKEQSQE